MRLTPEDYAALGLSWITPEIADRAFIYRLPSIEARELVGRKGGGDYSGIVFPYCWPGDSYSVLNRLRLDHPPLGTDARPEHKYLTAYGARNRTYFPPCAPELLTDVTVPVIITEGEKKCLALWRAALESANGNGKPTFLPMAFAGVWSWRGAIGVRTTANGERETEKGPLPDLDRVTWKDRKVTILFDSNARSNSSVAAARRELARELLHRGAKVLIADLPEAPGINGCDDFLYQFGPAKLEALLTTATVYDWRSELIVSEQGRARPLFANAVIALRSAPAWASVLAWDEFGLRVLAQRHTPWDYQGVWTDQEDRRACEWLQRAGIQVGISEAGQAVQTAAKDRSFHPVREYLSGLKWDHIGRINDWLTLYCHAEPSELTQAIGARWLISAVARVYEPGSKADCCLVLEGPQGMGKSSTFKILGGDWYTDDLADLGSKDAPISLRGKWIIEIAELDSISRAESSRVKAFVSRSNDYIRLPYDKRATDLPRESIFGGTINRSTYLFDETGARRFWPVACGRINLDSLKRDRDQLWAEAAERYRDGSCWWLDSQDLIAAAETEQSARYEDDPWAAPVATFIEGQPDTSISEVLSRAIRKDVQHWSQSDKNRVARILARLDWRRYRKRIGNDREWRYKPLVTQ